MSKKEKSDRAMTVMTQPSLHEAFEKRCVEEHRTVSEVIRELMSKHIKRWVQLHPNQWRNLFHEEIMKYYTIDKWNALPIEEQKRILTEVDDSYSPIEITGTKATLPISSVTDYSVIMNDKENTNK